MSEQTIEMEEQPRFSAFKFLFKPYWDDPCRTVIDHQSDEVYIDAELVHVKGSHHQDVKDLFERWMDDDPGCQNAFLLLKEDGVKTRYVNLEYLDADWFSYLEALKTQALKNNTYRNAFVAEVRDRDSVREQLEEAVIDNKDHRLFWLEWAGCTAGAFRMKGDELWIDCGEMVPAPAVGLFADFVWDNDIELAENKFGGYLARFSSILQFAGRRHLSNDPLFEFGLPELARTQCLEQARKGPYNPNESLMFVVAKVEGRDEDDFSQRIIHMMED